MCAHGWAGEGQAAHRSGAVQPRPQHVGRSGGCLARRNAGGLPGAPGRRGRNHGARVQREDGQDARGRAAQRDLSDRGLHAGWQRALLLAHGQQGDAGLRARAGNEGFARHAGLREGVSRRGAGAERPDRGGFVGRLPLSGGGDRPRRAGEARGYCLSRSDQAGLVLRRSDLGRGLAVFRRLRQGRVVREDGLQIAQLDAL